VARLVVVAALAFAPAAARADMKGARKKPPRRKASSPGTPPTIVEGAEELGADLLEKPSASRSNVVRTTAQVAYQRLLQDLKTTRSSVTSSRRPTSPLFRLAAAARFEKYTPEAESKIVPAFLNFDPSGYYHATSAGLVVSLTTRPR